MFDVQYLIIAALQSEVMNKNEQRLVWYLKG